MAEQTTRYAVVTGANRGIGLEICRQLASKGTTVVLTARDERRGLESVERLKKESGISDQNLLFHQLDVVDPASITSLAEFMKTQFGKLDILVNNAGVNAVVTNVDALRAGFGKEGFNFWDFMTETYELTEECLKINYHGSKRMCEAFIPLLQLSNSPRIVNVSSSLGKLKNLVNEQAKTILTSDSENLTEERLDDLVKQFLNEFKNGERWGKFMSAYVVSKAVLNAYTRVLAKKYPSILINAVCPGFVKTDLNHDTGDLTVEEGASSPVRLALLPNDGPSGCFFDRKELSEF